MLIQFTLNGHKVAIDVPEDITLLALLREHLGLTGTKSSCEIGECGACSVILNHRLVDSCITLAAKVDGQEVTTIEGIRSPEGGPNDLQENFIQYGAIQCGYCTPGMVVAGEVLLAENSTPSKEQIREALSGNLCRCTGYHQIFSAIEATAKGRKTYVKGRMGT